MEVCGNAVDVDMTAGIVMVAAVVVVVVTGVVEEEEELGRRELFDGFELRVFEAADGRKGIVVIVGR